MNSWFSKKASATMDLRKIGLLPEESLRKMIIALKESGKPARAYDTYTTWLLAGNIAASAHTVFHAAHAQLLSGASMELCTQTAQAMAFCSDSRNALWGDWFADTAMAQAMRGNVSDAKARLRKSYEYFTPDSTIKLARNHFFQARIDLLDPELGNSALAQLWRVRESLVREALIAHLHGDQSFDATLLRNVNWWTIVAAARYPLQQVWITADISASPFETAYDDAVNGTEFIRETRATHKKLLMLMKRSGRYGRQLCAWYIIRKDRS